MEITAIKDKASLAHMRGDWDAVYAADPEAQYFLSYEWLVPWLAGMKTEWMVLVAKPSSESWPVAFLPVRLRQGPELSRPGRREVMMAGNCAADYTGLICDPRYQDQAIPELGRYMRKQNWDLAEFQYVSMSRKRRQLFLSRFSRRDYEVAEVTREVNSDGINNHVCPRVSLPDDWETYLATRLGSNTRQKVRRFLRKVDGGDEFRITPVTDTQSFQQALDTMLALWLQKWGSRKGTEAARGIMRNMRGLLKCAFEQNTLFMPVLWHGDQQLGVLGSYVDTVKRSMLFLVAGCRTDINNPAPGIVLHAYSIRHAIAQGLTTYDFLRGDEPYKYAFGAEDHQICSISIRSRRKRAPVPAPHRPELPDWYQPPAQVVAQGGGALLAGKVKIGSNGLTSLPTQR